MVSGNILLLVTVKSLFNVCREQDFCMFSGGFGNQKPAKH
jgi:hypothetical protein